MKKNPKTKRADAERAAEWYVMQNLKCSEACRAVKTKWQRQDMFGSDVLGRRFDGNMVFVQATAGRSEAVRTRRRKLEDRVYKPGEIVQVVQLTWAPDPSNNRKKLWFFRVHDYTLGRWTTKKEAVPVPKHWFKSYKNARLKDEKETVG